MLRYLKAASKVKSFLLGKRAGNGMGQWECCENGTQQILSKNRRRERWDSFGLLTSVAGNGAKVVARTCSRIVSKYLS